MSVPTFFAAFWACAEARGRKPARRANAVEIVISFPSSFESGRRRGILNYPERFG
jgi:hypothetical protein